MTVTEKQAWLWRYQKARPRMDQIQGKLAQKGQAWEEMKRMEQQPCHPTQRRQLEQVKAGMGREMEALKRELAGLEEDRREIALAIEKVAEERFRQLLEYHYLEGWTWQQVACRMEYSPRYIYKLHKQALDAIECKGRKRAYHLKAEKCRMHCFPQREARA